MGVFFDLPSFLRDGMGLEEKEIEEILSARRGEETSFFDSLLDSRLVREEELLKTLARRFSMPYLEELPQGEENRMLPYKPSRAYLKSYPVYPFVDRGHIYAAINNPFNLEPLMDLSVLFKEKVTGVLSPSSTIISAINRAHGEGETHLKEIFDDISEDVSDSHSILRELEQGIDLLEEMDEAPVIKLVNHILSQGVRFNASDIHVEPYNTHSSIRYRLDGVLYNQLTLPRKVHSLIVSRIKIMAGLDISEKRLPQDGRIEIRVGDRLVDMRVATMPTGFGERVVLRLLEKGMRLMKLEEVGLNREMLARIRRLITLSHGIILVTGPTGSGKTTTLYAALQEINSPDKNILTIEDPIEYQIDGIGQTQVNPKIGLTFARGLRAMVRQDPDVILVGEIRDRETAEIAIQAALTGHLVFSTLHTNDAPSAITRLVDMGIEPFLVSSAVRAIIAQRLVRTLCPECKLPYSPSSSELRQMGVEWDEEKMKGVVLYRAGGCERCINTGYRGRVGIFELLEVNEDIQSLILTTYDSNVIRERARKYGLQSLKEYAVENVLLQGKTSVDEVLRVTRT